MEIVIWVGARYSAPRTWAILLEDGQRKKDESPLAAHAGGTVPHLALGLWASVASWKWAPPAPHHGAALRETIAMEGMRLSH